MAGLQKALEWAKKEDSVAESRHRKAENDYLKKFRDKLDAAKQWDYKTLKKNWYKVEVNDRPSCPRRNATAIELSIRQVNIDSRKGRFRLSENSDWYRSIMWMPESKRPKQSICD